MRHDEELELFWLEQPDPKGWPRINRFLVSFSFYDHFRCHNGFVTKWEFVNVLVCSVTGKSGGRAEVRFCCGPNCSAKFLVRVETKAYDYVGSYYAKADSIWYAPDPLSLTETLRLAENIAEKLDAETEVRAQA